MSVSLSRSEAVVPEGGDVAADTKLPSAGAKAEVILSKV